MDFAFRPPTILTHLKGVPGRYPGRTFHHAVLCLDFFFSNCGGGKGKWNLGVSSQGLWAKSLIYEKHILHVGRVG